MDMTPRTGLGKLDAGLRLVATTSEPGLGVHINPLNIDSSITPPCVNVRLQSFKAHEATKRRIVLARLESIECACARAIAEGGVASASVLVKCRCGHRF